MRADRAGSAGLLGLAIVVVALLASGPAPAHVPGLVLKGSGTAQVDGVMGAQEWKDAARQDFAALVPGGGTTSALIFVMNDAKNLYLAFRVARPSLGRTHVGFWFDDDHDGVSTPGREDGVSYGTGGLPGFLDEFRCQTGWCRDTDFGGPSDGTAAAKNEAGWSFYELSHPLASGDRGHDFSLSADSRIGFTAVLELHEAESRTSCVGVCNILDPASFGDIVIAQAQAPTPTPTPTATPTPKPKPGPKKPPNVPKRGVLLRAWMSLPGQQRPISTIGTATGLQANFVFKTEPVGGSRLRMVWFFERHKRLTFVYGVRNPVTSQLKRFDKPLAPGLYRAELSVRPPGSSYKRIGTVQARVG